MLSIFCTISWGVIKYQRAFSRVPVAISPCLAISALLLSAAVLATIGAISSTGPKTLFRRHFYRNVTTTVRYGILVTIFANPISDSLALCELKNYGLRLQEAEDRRARFVSCIAEVLLSTFALSAHIGQFSLLWKGFGKRLAIFLAIFLGLGIAC